MDSTNQMVFNLSDHTAIENDILKNTRTANGYPATGVGCTKSASTQSILDSGGVDYLRKKFNLPVNGTAYTLSYIYLPLHDAPVMREVIQTALDRIASVST